MSRRLALCRQHLDDALCRPATVQQTAGGLSPSLGICMRLEHARCGLFEDAQVRFDSVSFNVRQHCHSSSSPQTLAHRKPAAALDQLRLLIASSKRFTAPSRQRLIEAAAAADATCPRAGQRTASTAPCTCEPAGLP